MDFFREMAVCHLCNDPYEFVHPQPDLGQDVPRPDFLAINLRKKTLSVVQVDVSPDAEALLQQVNDYENTWLAALKANDLFRGYLEQGFHFQVHVYLRQSQAQAFFEKLTVRPRDPVKIRNFEEIGYPWEWQD